MTKNQTYLSYLLRIWNNQDAENPGLNFPLQIQIEEIQSGKNHQFNSLEAFIRYLESQVISSTSNP